MKNKAGLGSLMQLEPQASSRKPLFGEGERLVDHALQGRRACGQAA